MTGGSLCCQIRRQLDAGGSGTPAEPRSVSHHEAASSASSFLTASEMRGVKSVDVSPGLGPDRRAIPHAHPRPPGHRPVAPARHRRVRAEDPDWDDRDLTCNCNLRCLHPKLADEPIAGTAALGKDHHGPAVGQQPGCSASGPVPSAAMGKVLKAIADALDRNQLLKK